MAVAVCRAKDPNSCRVHGNGGEVEKLQAVADQAAVSNNVGLYLTTRAKIESLTDDEPTQFIAPDSGDLKIDGWKYSSGEIIAEAPNDMLIDNLHQSSTRELPDTPNVVRLLKQRGYSDQDILIAKHFGLGKDDNSSTVSVMESQLSRLTDEIENKNQVTFPWALKVAFISEYFPDLRIYGSYTHKTNRAHCKKFVDDLVLAGSAVSTLWPQK